MAELTVVDMTGKTLLGTFEMVLSRYVHDLVEAPEIEQSRELEPAN